MLRLMENAFFSEEWVSIGTVQQVNSEVNIRKIQSFHGYIGLLTM